jgi:hypothetical protein
VKRCTAFLWHFLPLPTLSGLGMAKTGATHSDRQQAVQPLIPDDPTLVPLYGNPHRGTAVHTDSPTLPGKGWHHRSKHKQPLPGVHHPCNRQDGQMTRKQDSLTQLWTERYVQVKRQFHHSMCIRSCMSQPIDVLEPL